MREDVFTLMLAVILALLAGCATTELPFPKPEYEPGGSKTNLVSAHGGSARELARGADRFH